MAGANLIVAGTGFSGRDKSIRAHCSPGREVLLIRDPTNQHDPNAVGVYVETALSIAQIGFLKAGAAKTWAKRMDSGVQVVARIESMYAPAGIDHPRISLRVETVDAGHSADARRHLTGPPPDVMATYDEVQSERGRPSWERFGIDPAVKEAQRQRDAATGTAIWLMGLLMVGAMLYSCTR